MTASDSRPVRDDRATLRRSLSTWSLTFYGVGVIVGAGIFVVTGKVAAIVGQGAWLAFVLAAVAALPTGLSYAELASRFPLSAGEAVYVERGFGARWLSFTVGFLVLASGVSSSAAVSHGFTSYLGELVTLPGWAQPLTLVVFLAALSLVSYRGIEESTWFNAFCTVLSVGALLVLVAVGIAHWGEAALFDFTPPPAGHTGGGLGAALTAAVALAFYAFVGFEDMCNVAEEVREPERTIPRAIVITVLFITVLYAAVSITVTAVASPAELASSKAPLALVWERLLPGIPVWVLSAVALFAVANTALVNLVMGSRILYGMGRDGLVPAGFAYVSPRRRTPSWGVVAMFVLAAVFALTGFLRVLAEATSAILLFVFLLVNASLLAIRLRGSRVDVPSSAKPFRVPLVVPGAGLVLTAYLMTRFSAGAYLRAGVLLATGVALHLVARWVERYRR